MTLTATGISVRFGGVRAVTSVSLSVGDGEVLGLVGPNGSGKSTFLNALSGIVAATGSAELGGRPLPLGRPGAIRRLGVLRTFQTAQTFTALSCLDNVLLSTADRRATGAAAAWLGRRAMWRHETHRWEAAHRALERVGLADVADLPAGELPYGGQRLLELARARAGEPRILLLDEPSAGLNATETAQLGRLLAGWRAEGLALLVVDHKVDFLDGLCDRVAVFDLGSLLAEGPPGQIWRDPRVMDAYLGVAADG